VTDTTRDLFLAMNARALEAPSPGEEIEPPSAFDRLSNLVMPTLVIVGDLDMSLMLDRGRHVAEFAPNARLEVMEGTAHLPQLEQPTVFASLVTEFLSGL
jgi:pimeloyl-ACP methyl ester carboxylesterase